MAFVDSSGRELVDVGGADMTINLGSVQIEDPTTPAQKMAVDAHGSGQTRLADVSGADLAGGKTTAAAMPAGGSGLLGWLSAIAGYLAGILSVNLVDAAGVNKATVDGHGSQQSVMRDASGGDATGASGTGISALTGATGLLGWLSSIFQLLAPATPQMSSATHAQVTITLAAAGAGKRNVLTHLAPALTGSGTAPSNSSPVDLQVQDGATVVFEARVNGFLAGFSSQPFVRAVQGTANTAMSIVMADPGANNTIYLNVGSLTA